MLKQVISVGAWRNNVLIGFARAVSDHKFRAYIEDVVIHKDYQKSGIGTKLVSKLLNKLSHIFICKGHYYDLIELFRKFNPDTKSMNNAGKNPITSR